MKTTSFKIYLKSIFLLAFMSSITSCGVGLNSEANIEGEFIETDELDCEHLTSVRHQYEFTGDQQMLIPEKYQVPSMIYGTYCPSELTIESLNKANQALDGLLLISQELNYAFNDHPKWISQVKDAELSGQSGIKEEVFYLDTAVFRKGIQAKSSSADSEKIQPALNFIGRVQQAGYGKIALWVTKAVTNPLIGSTSPTRILVTNAVNATGHTQCQQNDPCVNSYETIYKFATQAEKEKAEDNGADPLQTKQVKIYYERETHKTVISLSGFDEALGINHKYLLD